MLFVIGLMLGLIAIGLMFIFITMLNLAGAVFFVLGGG